MYTRNRSEEPLDDIISVTIQLMAEVKTDVQGNKRRSQSVCEMVWCSCPCTQSYHLWSLWARAAA